MEYIKYYFKLIFRALGMEKETVVFDESTSIDPDEITWISIGEFFRVTTEIDEDGATVTKSLPVILISTSNKTFEFPNKEPFLSAALKCKLLIKKKNKLKP